MQSISPQQHQIIQKSSPVSTIHTANSEIKALVTSIQNSNQFQTNGTASLLNQLNLSYSHCSICFSANIQKTGSNAAIISLLNSAPAAMTSSPVVNNNLSTSNLQLSTNPTNLPPDTLLNTKPSSSAAPSSSVSQPTILHQTISGDKYLTGNLRKISIQQQPQHQQAGTSRIINPTNLITVSAVGNVLNQGQYSIQTQPQQQQHTNILTQDMSQTQQQQPINVRVTMSALASQLASPPALMSNASIQPQNFNFAQTSVINHNNNNNNNNNIAMKQQQQQQQVILNTTNARLLNQTTQSIRRDSMAAPSPGSDSNASNTSSSNISFSVPGLNALLATSPTSAGDNHNTSALMERLTNTPLSQQSISSQSPGQSPSSSQFMSPSPKANTNTVQHIQVQSPASISPLSSPPPQQQHQQPQTTTLSLQGINFQSLQGAMATFPHLQNVQVSFIPVHFTQLLYIVIIEICAATHYFTPLPYHDLFIIF